jgi:hypothetical protein
LKSKKWEVIYMNMRQRLLAGATVVLLTATPVWAGGANSNHDGGNGGGEHFKAHDEIARKSGKNDHDDVARKSWKNAIARVTGAFHETANSNHDGGNGGGEHFKAPEIDAAYGTSALALLTGVLLLVSERSRSRRPEDKENKDA